MRHIKKICAASLLLAFGCGDESSGAGDGGTDGEVEMDAYVFVPGNHVANPEPVPYGGVGSGAIDGEINVFVVHADTNEPIDGAEVRIGDADTTSPRVDSTDADGLVVFRGAGLSGAQVVTATAEGYAAATWIGANGAVITIPLEPTDPLAARPTATVSGTIADWETFPLGANGYLFAAIAYSLADGEDDLVDQGMAAGNFCFRIPGFADGPCEWTLVTRTGALAVYALIYLGDNNGTPLDDTDDTIVFYTYALKTGLELEEDETLIDQEMAMLDPTTDFVTTGVSYGVLPTGLVDVQWLAMLELGDAGNLAFPATPGVPDLGVPALTGELASFGYRMVAFAQPAPDDDAPQSAILHRTTDVDGTVDIGSWLPMPYSLAATTGTYSFSLATGATVHAVEFTSTADGTRRWSVLPLDGSTSFRLPTIDPDPLVDDTDMTVRAFEVPSFNPSDFSLENVIDDVTRLSSDRVTFTP